MGGKQSTAGRPRASFPGVSADDSAVPVPPSAHFSHYRSGGTMGLRSRSVSSVAAMGIEHSPALPFGFYTSRNADPDRAGVGGADGTPAASHGTDYQDAGGGRHHTEGVLYLGSRGSLADTLPLHITPRWLSAHSGFKCPVCSKSVASNEMELHFIMCLSKPRLSYNVVSTRGSRSTGPAQNTLLTDHRPADDAGQGLGRIPAVEFGTQAQPNTQKQRVCILKGIKSP
ncbi:E3 ubiquitin-protein ligase znrf1 isoform X1 [Nerophis lumbriciformis]|uniref:E3 ubiquitin-protein ligase znrf1 isoform X1 n=1 Tax=Nerophis lumbriciformis TaxID=546530 RepID=UPI002AE01814|nr:E3 ubiquitin-protein ligase znrf1-like isoform X1 [Nerophis lumbriciformis]